MDAGGPALTASPPRSSPDDDEPPVLGASCSSTLGPPLTGPPPPPRTSPDDDEPPVLGASCSTLGASFFFFSRSSYLPRKILT